MASRGRLSVYPKVMRGVGAADSLLAALGQLAVPEAKSPRLPAVRSSCELVQELFHEVLSCFALQFLYARRDIGFSSQPRSRDGRALSGISGRNICLGRIQPPRNESLSKLLMTVIAQNGH